MLNLARTRREFKSLRTYQGGWVQIVYYIVVLILTIVLAPKPPKPRAATLEDFDVPVAEEDRAIPVLFGTWRITGANVVWYGNLSTKKIKKSGLFSSTTVGYKYFLGMHLALCHGPVDAFLKLEAADKLAWEGDVTENENITVAQLNLFGGEKREGGLYLSLDVEMGEPDQAANDYLESSQPAPVPAYRGVFCLVSRTGEVEGVSPLPGRIRNIQKLGYVGTTPYVKAWAITARRILKGWNTDVWYEEKAVITMDSGTGMNPAHIVYQCLTDPEWGMSGDPDEDIDLATFTAAADTLFDEGFGLNMLWNQQSTIEDFIGTVLDHIAGVLTFDCSTGKYQLKLIRGDYVAEDLPIFDESNLVDMGSCERRSWGETVNELTLSFTDATSGKATSIIVQDLGNIRSQGGIRIPGKADFTAINDPALMRVVAGRELLAGATPLARIELTATRAFWEQTPGGVIRAKWDAHKLPLTVFRVISTRGGTLQNGMITAQCVEDIYALSGIEYAEVPQPPTPETPPDNPEEPDDNSGSVKETRTAPPDPETVQDGDRYIIGPGGGTGEWAGQPEGTIVEADVDGDQWIFSPAPPGALIYDESTGQHFSVDEYGAQQASPWTPAIPPLTEELTPDLGDLQLVAYNTDDDSYVKVAADQVGGGASTPTVSSIVGGLGPNGPDTPPAEADQADDEFEFGVTLDEDGDRRFQSNPWVWRNEDATTAAILGGNLVLLAPADAGRELHGVEQLIEQSTSGFKYRAKFAIKHASGNTQMAGIYVGEVGGKLLSLSWGYTGGALTLQADRWTSATAHSSAQGASTSVDELHDAMDWLYIEVENDLTNIIFRYSKTGVENTFVTFYTEAIATHLASDPVVVGLWAASSNAGQTTVAVFDWFRRVPAAGFVYPPSVLDLSIRSIQDLVLDLEPTFYVTCKDGGGGFTDLSGNGYHLTDSGTVHHGDSVFLPAEPNTKFVRLPSGTNYSAYDFPGNDLGAPLTGDWTLMACVCQIDSTINWPIVVAGSGESESVNYQAAMRIESTTGELSAFWEHSSGTNDQINSGIALQRGRPYIVHIVKDGTANTVAFYLNGIKLSTVAYSTEPTGGTNINIGIGDVGTVGTTGEILLAHCAFWNGTKISDENIAKLARAAGLFGPPYIIPPAGQTVANSADIQVFETPGGNTWNKPPGGKLTEGICVAGGGGGGGGRKGATSTTRAGGGGGGGGGVSRFSVPTDQLGDTETVQVGSGGAGGAGATADNGTGTSGSDGTESTFSNIIRALPGLGGNGSTANTNAGGAGGAGILGTGSNGGLGGTTTAAAASAAAYAGGGGGGGGGVTSGNAFGDGEDGGGVTLTSPALAGGAGGPAQTDPGSPGNSTGKKGIPGSGGGGGAGNLTAGSSGGDGGDGGLYGGGGGGGAGCINGAGKAGDGGDGANGIVVVLTI